MMVVGVVFLPLTFVRLVRVSFAGVLPGGCWAVRVRDLVWAGQAAWAGGPVAAWSRFIHSCSRCQPWSFAAEHGPVVYKTFRGLPGGGDGSAGAIWTQRIDPGTFDSSMAVTAQLFQAELPKTSDVRVTVVGSRVFAQQICAPDGALDWRQGDWDQLSVSPVAVPSSVRAGLHRYLASYDLAFGCFDFAVTGEVADVGSWVFVECNPNGQWGWLPDADQIAAAFADVLCREDGRI